MFLLFSDGFPIILRQFSDAFPMVFICFAYGFPMDFLCFSHAFPRLCLCFSYGFPMDFLPFFPFPTVFPDGFPIDSFPGINAALQKLEINDAELHGLPSLTHELEKPRGRRWERRWDAGRLG